MKILRYLLISIVLLAVTAFAVYKLGPKPEFEKVTASMPSFNLPIEQLPQKLEEEESLVKNLKPNNESRIIWADSIRKTPYVMVYLHGFSASPMEGDPVHRELAKKFGCNLYLPRLKGHGLDDPESFKDLTPTNYLNSAKKALAYAQLLGDSILLMSCSTGGTLSIYLAANNPGLVHSLIMYSPNIEVFDPNLKLATGPWGPQIMETVLGSKYRVISSNEGKEEEKYWTGTYRIEGLVALQALLDQTMTEETFSKIDIPYFVGYWYKNEEEQDHTVSVEAIKEFDQMTHTPDSKKQMVNFPEAGAHVMTSSLVGKDVPHVIEETSKFLQDILGMKTAGEGEE